MWCIRNFRSSNLYIIIIVTKIMKGFLKKRKGKSLLCFYDYDVTQQVEFNHGKKEPFERGSS